MTSKHQQLSLDDTILEYLRRYGQRVDAEIATGTRVDLATVRRGIERLRDAGQIMACTVTRFTGEQATQFLQCRLSGSVPASSPGRKPGAQSAG